MISTLTVDAFQDKNKLQTSNFPLSLWETKDKVKRKEGGMMRITV